MRSPHMSRWQEVKEVSGGESGRVVPVPASDRLGPPRLAGPDTPTDIRHSRPEDSNTLGIFPSFLSSFLYFIMFFVFF